MEQTRATRTDTIVVGVDSSPSGAVALDWAVDEARRRHLRVHLVRVVREGAGATSLVGAEAVAAELDAEREALAQVVATVGDDLEVTSEVRLGPPGATLVGIAADATMLVVGPRRHGSIGRALLGSVSTYCTHHARCPVVVVARETSAA